MRRPKQQAQPTWTYMSPVPAGSMANWRCSSTQSCVRGQAAKQTLDATYARAHPLLHPQTCMQVAFGNFVGTKRACTPPAPTQQRGTGCVASAADKHPTLPPLAPHNTLPRAPLQRPQPTFHSVTWWGTSFHFLSASDTLLVDACSMHGWARHAHGRGCLALPDEFEIAGSAGWGRSMLQLGLDSFLI